MTYRTFPYHVTQMRSQSHRRGRRLDDPQNDGRILYRKHEIGNITLLPCGTSDTRVRRTLFCSIRFISLTDVVHYPTPCRGSAKALPYNFTATSLVGEGLVAQPQTAPLCPLGTSPTGRPLPKPFQSIPPKREANQLFRRDGHSYGMFFILFVGLICPDTPYFCTKNAV